MTKQSSSDTSQISHANPSTNTFQDRPSLHLIKTKTGHGEGPVTGQIQYTQN